jgi:small subunit ribosomal protein S20
MPTTKSAVKRDRIAEKRRQSNTAVRSEIRTQRRKVLEAIAASNKPEAQQRLSELASLYDKAVKRNVLKLNTAARHKSRIAARINALPA